VPKCERQRAAHGKMEASVAAGANPAAADAAHVGRVDAREGAQRVRCQQFIEVIPAGAGKPFEPRTVHLSQGIVSSSSSWFLVVGFVFFRYYLGLFLLASATKYVLLLFPLFS